MYILKIFILICLIVILNYLLKDNREHFESKTLHGIPKVIYQTYNTKHLPYKLRQNRKYIRRLNKGWKYELYDDKMIKKFILDEYGKEMLSIYNKLNPIYGPARSDFFRYLLIYKKGGVYLDIKSAMSKPLDNIILEKDTYYLSHWKGKASKDLFPPNGEFQQWFIVAPPKHPFLKNVINRMCERILDKDNKRRRKVGVLYTTGPFVYTEAINELLPKYRHKIFMDNNELGFIYKNIKGSHKKYFKNHYTTLKDPVILH